MSRKAIGIMGGTFDPIHYGHLVTAEAARVAFNLNTVFFVPSGRPPHKEGQEVSDQEARYLMTVLAVTSNKDFTVSRVEIERPGKSYAFDTVRYFKEAYPDTDIFFITGADAIKEILKWHRVNELLDYCYFVAATRPGYDLEELKARELNVLPPEKLEKIFTIEVTAMAISSTDIKKRVKDNKTIKYLLPESVEAYIWKEGLYFEK